jgi:transcription initiation factor TFIIH subunit 3
MAPISSSNTNIQDRSLVTLIIDLTPTTWGERNQIRILQDKKRAEANKDSIGPAKIDEILASTLAFGSAFAASHRDNALVLIGVAGSQVSVLYPRKGKGMDAMVGGDIRDGGGCKIDPSEMRECFLLGVAQLVAKSTEVQTQNPSATCEASIAAATSLALCILNRFQISRGNGAADGEENSLLHRKEDTGILSMIASSQSNQTSSESQADAAMEQRLAQRRARGMLSPRILILQATEDATRDYNAFMNCVFCANKQDIVIDGCFIGSGRPKMAETSSFLEQACDRTGGVFAKPKGLSQIGGILTEVFLTVFLPPLGIRKHMNLPKVNTVDFRARCFETGESLDMGLVCNLCLSIFKREPKDGCCLTCGAIIQQAESQVDSGKLASSTANNENSVATNSDAKRMRRV